jgi:hypothetical protein
MKLGGNTVPGGRLDEVGSVKPLPSGIVTSTVYGTSVKQPANKPVQHTITASNQILILPSSEVGG